MVGAAGAGGFDVVVVPATVVGGGIVSRWPSSMWSAFWMLLAATSCATVTPNCWAMRMSESPFCTMYSVGTVVVVVGGSVVVGAVDLIGGSVWGAPRLSPPHHPQPERMNIPVTAAAPDFTPRPELTFTVPPLSPPADERRPECIVGSGRP